MDQNRNDIVDDLITRCLTGEASADEQEQLASWIAQRKENEQYYLGMSKVLDLGNRYYPTTPSGIEMNIDREWDHFVEQINTNGKGKTVVMDPRPATRWMRVAAAFLILVASGLVINYFISKDEATVYTTADNTLSVELPDGSKVDLNRHSELTVSPSFGKDKREVKLTGEGFYDVVRDPQKPFFIQVGETQVEVLGTSFNIRGYTQGDVVEVSVVTGTVKLSVPEKKVELKLLAGEKGIYSRPDQQLIQQMNEDANFLSWKTGKIIFADANLETVVSTLNRVYSVSIQVTAKIPATCSVTVTFDHQTLEAVLNVLKDTLNLTYRVEGNKIEITQVGC